MLCDHFGDSGYVEKRLEGVLFDGHRLSRHGAKVKPGEKPFLLVAMLNNQHFDCCLKAQIF